MARVSPFLFALFLSRYVPFLPRSVWYSLRNDLICFQAVRFGCQKKRLITGQPHVIERELIALCSVELFELQLVRSTSFQFIFDLPPHVMCGVSSAFSPLGTVYYIIVS